MRSFCLLALLLLACNRPSPSRSAFVDAASASALPEGGVPLAPVGLASFDPAPAAAIAKNDRGVALLAKGKATEAVQEIEGALALSPDFIRARYNLACAYARAGNFDKARASLEVVYEADFIAIRPHADHDDDLVGFWKSAQGIDLAARKSDYEARFAAAIKRGVAATVWVDGVGPRGSLRPSVLRVGVFDPESLRFVAVAPPVRNAIFGYASSTVPYAVVVTGTVADMLGGDLDAGMTLEAVHVFHIATDGVETTTMPAPSTPYFGELYLGPSGVTLHVQQAGVAFDGANSNHYAALFDTTIGGPTQRTLFDGIDKMPAVPRDRSVRMEVGYNHWGYVVTENDPAYAYSKQSHELTLPSRKVIAIPKSMAFYEAPARVIPSPSGDRVVLLWNATVLECEHARDIPGRFKMALVDVVSGQVSSLGEGDGAGAAAYRASGELFVQRGKKVEQLTDAGPKELPAHVLLVPELTRDDACGF